MEQLPDFTDPFNFLLLTIAMFVIVIGRYFLIAGLFQWIFHNKFKKQFAHRKLSAKQVDQKQFLKEVQWSVITSLIFVWRCQSHLLNSYFSEWLYSSFPG